MRHFFESARLGHFQKRRPVLGWAIMFLCLLLTLANVFWWFHVQTTSPIQVIESQVAFFLLVALLFSVGADLLYPAPEDEVGGDDDAPQRLSEEYVSALEREHDQLNMFLVGMLAEHESTGSVENTVAEVREYYDRVRRGDE